MRMEGVPPCGWTRGFHADGPWGHGKRRAIPEPKWAVDACSGDLIYYAPSTCGGMAERLGRGLQIRLQRFNSASHLQATIRRGFFI